MTTSAWWELVKEVAAGDRQTLYLGRSQCQELLDDLDRLRTTHTEEQGRGADRLRAALEGKHEVARTLFDILRHVDHDDEKIQNEWGSYDGPSDHVIALQAVIDRLYPGLRERLDPKTTTVELHISLDPPGSTWGDDRCECGKAPCGLVSTAKVSPDCRQHNEQRPWQVHTADECPGNDVGGFVPDGSEI